MKRKNVSLLLALCIALFFSARANAQTVTIDSQVWCTKNLDVTTFRNGDVIPQAKNHDEWKSAVKNKQPAWCYYYYDPVYGEKYGKLYNWYAVSDYRGLAPVGFHIPSEDEYSLLKLNLDEEWRHDHNGMPIGVSFMGLSGNKLKSTSGWANGGNGDNSSGFNAQPGGCCFHKDGKFGLQGSMGFWWTASSTSAKKAYRFNLWSGGNRATECVLENKGNGYSVRCLKD
jgi:uncharacterized protein (TIGR02145 family)